MKRYLLALGIFVALSQQAVAKTEDWYWGFDLGWGKPFYSGTLKTAVDALAAQSGMSRIGLGGGLGFYWPLENKITLLGVAARGIHDNFSSNGATLGLHSNLLSFSAIHTFAEEPYVGFFLRGDAGFASLRATASGSGVSVASETDAGFGLSGGGGYGLLLSDETRLIFQGTFSFIHVDGKDVLGLIITAGPVF